MIAQSYIEQGYPIERVLHHCDLSKSSYYYQPLGSKNRGRPKSWRTFKITGEWANNEQVIFDILSILNEEFVDYGYYKVTCALRQDYQYLINPKKVYRLMSENQLLNKHRNKPRSSREWVKELLPNPECDLSYWEIDIKYIYIQGMRRNAMALTLIDVSSRWVLGHLFDWSISKHDVIRLFESVFTQYDLPNRIFVRNDNGSQFEATLVQQYLKSKHVHQEFIKPATPQQNAHIESYHSIVESVLCNAYDFDTLWECQNIMNRFIQFYNYKRIHSGIGYLSPYKYLLQKGTDLKVNLSPSEVLLLPIQN